MTDLKQLVRTIQSLPPDKAETVLRNYLQKEWESGYSVATTSWTSIARLQSDAAARGANNLPTGYDNDY